MAAGEQATSRAREAFHHQFPLVTTRPTLELTAQELAALSAEWKAAREGHTAFSEALATFVMHTTLVEEQLPVIAPALSDLSQHPDRLQEHTSEVQQLLALQTDNT